MFKLTLESTHFIFNKCPIYTNDGASAKFITNSHETDNSTGVHLCNLLSHTDESAVFMNIFLL